MSSPPLKRPTPPTSENGSIEESPTKRLKVEGDSGNESRVTTRPGSVEGQVEGHIEGQVDGHIEVHIEGRIEGQIEEQIEQNEVLEYGELEENSEEVGAIMVNTRLFDDDPRRLLERSVALVLDHIGFDSASKEAMEALCCEVDTYAAHFLAKITSMMLNARRTQPTPKDFEYALKQSNLSLSSLEPHLRPPVPKSKIQIQMGVMPPEDLTYNDITKLIGDELSGDQEKLRLPHIPKNFPSFPSKHTYKWTEMASARETDPRKIREEAAKVARQGEEALRRLTKVAKAGQEKDVKNAASKDPKSKQRHELWEETVRFLGTAVMPDAAVGGSPIKHEEDKSMIVNADRSFHRKGLPPKRKQQAPLMSLADLV